MGPRTSSAFVCLRCEARLARWPWPALPRRPAHARFSASARPRHDAQEVEDQPQPTEVPITKVVQPLNRLIKTRRGQVVRETSARLKGIKRLGDDAEILVLKEMADLEHYEEPVEEPDPVQPYEPVEVPDIAAALQNEGKAVIPDDIYQQVMSLCPTNNGEPNEPHYVKQITFVKLRKALMKSFTQRQLMVFYSVAKNIQQSKVNKGVLDSIMRDRSDPKRPVERSEWQPGTTRITERLPGVDRHVKVMGWRRYVSKQLLVDRILRDAWNLALLEEVEAPGEIELFLRPWQLALLRAGEKETVLDRIGRSRQAKLEVVKQQDVLRITADKTTAEYAADDIETALQTTVTERMNLLPYKQLLVDGIASNDRKSDLTELISRNILDAVSKLTQTTIEVNTKLVFTIRGFDNAAVEEAKRTLVKFLPLKDSTVRTFDTLKLPSAKSMSFLLPIFPEEQSMDYKYRDKQLGRISVPVVRLTEPEHVDNLAGESPKIPKTSLSGLLTRTMAAVLKTTSDTPKSLEAAGIWVPEPEYSLSAEIGQTLFPLEHTDPAEAIRAALAQPSQVAFLPTFPGLSSLLTSPEVSATACLRVPALLYDFRPSPEQPDFQPGQMFPSLRIQMRPGSGYKGAKPIFRKLTLSFQDRIHDVLLPNKAIDVRFARRGSLTLRKDHNDKNVQEWVEAVLANIQGGGRLTAPPLSLEIPESVIPGLPTDSQNLRLVNYDFSGIQFRQSVTGNLFGESISYSAVQAGRFGAKFAALTAHYDGHGDTQLRDEVAVKAFVKRSFEIVDLVNGASMQTLPVARQWRPRDENSARRMRREQEGFGPKKLDEGERGLEERMEQGQLVDDAELHGGPAEETHAKQLDDSSDTFELDQPSPVEEPPTAGPNQ
ncbi:respiratory complex assembly rmp1 [Pyrenophora seminiperda CCB06]|uniref:Respiratory complex assembly rmp1 n=1 Tax=Pyrenophora seminiperda CCB06 TaxID=1302712 RepID=A0A3M7LW23_9PLEO|nr:respiratory complex assembly rmp1 [Pyrenophora seminiperda CCB06]